MYLFLRYRIKLIELAVILEQEVFASKVFDLLDEHSFISVNIVVLKI